MGEGETVKRAIGQDIFHLSALTVFELSILISHADGSAVRSAFAVLSAALVIKRKRLSIV